MKLFSNYLGRAVHEVDRAPEKQSDIEHLSRMFPSCVLKRKSNGKPIWIKDVKIKNIRWYI